MRKPLRGKVVRLGSALSGVLLFALQAHASFVTFESGQVRPLALAPTRSQLFAVNTPDNRLEIFDVDALDGDLTHVGAVPVGLEPVAVAVRPDETQVWVVNHLSDSVSVIDLTVDPPRVVRTLLVGDEPRDILFAGTNGDRAFITTAHRGQNTSLQATIETVLRTPGIGRADVWAFDADSLGSTLEGTPLSVITLFGDTPRALAADPEGHGATVYAATFHSGNLTTTVAEGVVCNDTNLNNDMVQGSCTISGTTYPGGLPLPEDSSDNVNRPETGLIVKFSGGQWRDELNRNWNNAVKFTLLDQDVFKINANANPPAPIAGPSGVFAGVGTVLFNMVVDPTDDTRVYVTNTEARNEVRFEGPPFEGGTTVRGHLHEARVTLLDGSSVLPRHLNKHINYAQNMVPSPMGVEDESLATPVGMAITGDGTTLYVAAFGSSKIGVYDTMTLDSNTFVPATVPHIAVMGGGPSGLVLNENVDRLYVFTRFDNSISVIDTVGNSEIAHLPVHNPEPAHVVDGRPFLYDALLTSSNGEASCSSCHVFGDLDSLGWDLGNPGDVVLNNPNPFRVTDPLGTSFPDHHPMKGPMTTQSLRGMANHGPMHWRGDRTGGNDPGGDALDEDAAFKKFNVAFAGLLGNNGPLTGTQMQAFTDFILEVTYPPNPIRALDNVLVGDQAAGENFYLNSNPSDVFQTCNGCHALNRASGFFGSDGFSSFENEPQQLKIPHLRNMYQKVGMFGMPAVPFFNPGDNGAKGNQIRGFGFLHDGSVDTLFRFHQAVVFNECIPGFGCINGGGFPSGAVGDTERRQVEAFMFVFDSNLAPIVGQQVTLTGGNGLTVDGRLDLLIAQADSDYFPGTKHCDLVVKGNVLNPGTMVLEPRGWLFQPASNDFRSDRTSEPLLADAALRAVAGGTNQELTYTCVPPGSGERIGLDRDEDGYYDTDENDAGSDPADPTSIPGGGGSCPPAPQVGCKAPGKSTLLMTDDPNDRRLNWKWLKGAQTTLGELGDPVNGSTAYTLCVYSGPTNQLVATVDIPAQGTCSGTPCWKTAGSGLKYKDAGLVNDGTQLMLLKSGATGSAKTIVKAKGPNLGVPAFAASGLALPVTVELNNSDDECWSAAYPAAIKNDDEQFKGKL